MFNHSWNKPSSRAEDSSCDEQTLLFGKLSLIPPLVTRTVHINEYITCYTTTGSTSCLRVRGNKNRWQGIQRHADIRGK